jgi:hypothetical protein
VLARKSTCTVAEDEWVRQCPEGQLVPANLWFKNAPDGEMLREMKHTSDTFERVLSLLIVSQVRATMGAMGKKGRMTATTGSSGAGGRWWEMDRSQARSAGGGAVVGAGNV